MTTRIGSSSPDEALRKEEATSFWMLFCALILGKKDKAAMEESVAIVLLLGRAKLLAGELLPQTPE